MQIDMNTRTHTVTIDGLYEMPACAYIKSVMDRNARDRAAGRHLDAEDEKIF